MWRGRMVVSNEARAYKAQVGWIAKERQVKPLAGAVSLTVRVFRPQKRGDLDNTLKVLGDALQGIAYANDKQIRELHAYLGDDSKRPRVEVELSHLGQLPE